MIIDGIDVNDLYSDQIACMNRYEVARLFIKTVEQLEAKEQENDKLKQVLSEIKGNAYCIMNDDEDEGPCYDRAREIVEKIDEVLNDR